jgi:hypothetical protein
MCQLATGRSLKLPGIETTITRNVGAEIRQDAQAIPRDEARRIAANIPKLLELLRKS